MATERCGVCGARAPLGDSTHLLVNPSEGEVTDYYVCAGCYEDEVVPLFEADPEAQPRD